MRLSNADLVALIAQRHALHQTPDVSGDEAGTAAQIVAALHALSPDEIVTGLGGQGVAALFQGAQSGPTVMFRAELDGLPIAELSDLPYRSTHAGKGHLCGHDGHMVLLLGLARQLARRRPARGRVVLMFQPAEEDGSGARAVVQDPRYAALRPDWAFAIHNWPGAALGQARLAAGVVNCASQGLRIMLEGKTAHAAEPENGLSPAQAMAQLMPALMALDRPGPLGQAYQRLTLTHATLGAQSFGIAPGAAEIWVTLRTTEDAQMAALQSRVVDLAQRHAAAFGLKISFAQQDSFAASVNDPEAVAQLERSLTALQIPFDDSGLPERASEDFGVFGWGKTKSAMLFLGAGETAPALHNPDYDFPDALIEAGVAIFHHLARDILG
jgi:amidohydrolase